MQITSQELDQVAAAQAPRFDMYSGIHKAMRALMADALLALGRMDTEDDLALAQGTERVLQLLDACRSYLLHENTFVHAAIEARAPGASDRIAHEHGEHASSTCTSRRRRTTRCCGRATPTRNWWRPSRRTK